MFAIPTGIFGAGFEAMIQSRKQGKVEQAAQEEEDSPDAEAEDSAWGTSNTEELIRAGGGQRPEFSFLDTTTARGKMYRNVLLAVVILNIAALFTSTLDYIQVSLCFRSVNVMKCHTPPPPHPQTFLLLGVVHG